MNVDPLLPVIFGALAVPVLTVIDRRWRRKHRESPSPDAAALAAMRRMADNARRSEPRLARPPRGGSPADLDLPPAASPDTPRSRSAPPHR